MGAALAPRRYAVVLGLTLAAGLLTVLAARPFGSPAVPDSGRLTAGTGWTVVATDARGGWSAWPYRQWLLRDTHGDTVTLYLSATASPKMGAWDGSLAYRGAGYQVENPRRQNLRLRDGTQGEIAVVNVRRLTRVYTLAYTVVTPGGTTDDAIMRLLRVSWDMLRGEGGPYYVVRVAAQDPHAMIVIDRFLTALLPALRAEARAHTPAS